MIAYINGTIIQQSRDAIIVENNGVGYQIFCGNPQEFSLNAFYKVYTYFHVREDAMILFGFKTEQDCEIFKLLISVKGVGPKTGINILGFSGGKSLLQAIENNDVSYLKTLPGVGTKTASQILLDLQGKFVVDQEVVPVAKQSVEDAVDALLGLGFKRNELSGLRKTLNEEASDNVNELVKRGLQILNQRKGG